MNNNLRVLITGTNKGIGNDLVKIFYKNHQNAIIYATSRQSPQIAAKRWKQFDPNNFRIKPKHLQINSLNSIKLLASQLSKQSQKIDIIIHNAAIADNLKDQGKVIQPLEYVNNCFDTNLKGPIYLTQNILSLLSSNCIVVNISSLFGGLKFQPKYVQDKFTNPNITRQDIFSSIQEYIQGVKYNNLKNYNLSVYGTSKMMLQAWSRFILQRKMLKLSQKSICVSPGFCRTPMTEGFRVDSPAHTSYSGAQKIYQTILLPDLDPYIFYHRARKSDFYHNGDGLPF